MTDNNTPWWRGAIFYQIYPRSYQDSNGDGIGDLPGIIQRLDHVAGLGVDAIWISPFFRSPMADFGYDVADPCDVDPMFGTLADFDHLLEQAHARGLKVVIDQVPSHTSVEHRWFQESRQSRDNPRADWYVWADPKPDGSPPNNWLSIFGGVAWQWEPRRQQYYLHNFLAEQPDLNFHNPAVVEAVLDNLRFWLERGVDGFRLDAINFCYQDRGLRDNPAKPEHLRTGRGFSPDNPYAYQYHWYNNTQPENLGFIERVRALMDQYPDTTTLGEISAEDSVATMAEYVAPGRLHMAYSFELLADEFSAGFIRHTVERMEASMGDGWACWAVSNHDVERVVSRWGEADHHDELACLMAALLCCLRGSVCLYQGEELGLPEAELEYTELRDPYGIAFWPNFKGRDGCRTPMPWSDAEHGDFSSVQPWLPVPESHKQRAVCRQEQRSDSTLQRFRKVLSWCRRQPVLREGSIAFLDSDEPVLMFVREADGERWLCAFNLSTQEQRLPIASDFSPAQLQTVPGPNNAHVDQDRLVLPGYAMAVLCQRQG